MGTSMTISHISPFQSYEAGYPLPHFRVDLGQNPVPLLNTEKEASCLLGHAGRL